MATVTKVSSGKYKAIIRQNGKFIKSKTFFKRSHARAWAKRIESDIEQLYALGLPGAKKTFKEVAREFIEAKNRSATRLNWFVKTIGPSKPITEITTADIREALETFAGQKCLNKDAPRSPATRNRAKALLSATFKFAIEQGYLTLNPVRGIPALPENNRRQRFLSEDELDRLLTAAKNSSWSRMHLLISMAIVTGARRAELSYLRWSDIDFDQCVARLEKTKNGDPRVLPLTMPVIAELKKIREVGDGLIFPSHRKPDTPYHWQKPWKRVLTEAGLGRDGKEAIVFHTLRHQCATTLAMSGASLLEIAEILGHRSLNTTQRYAHLSAQHKAKIVNRVFSSL